MTMHESSLHTATSWDEGGELEVVTFDLGPDTFALEAAMVREILDPLPETPVPGASPLVGSVVNFRGKIIPIADLRRAFGLGEAAATADSRVIVIELDAAGEPLQFGLRTDKVHEVATLSRDASEAPPAVGMRWRRDYVRELVRRGDDVVVLPDLSAIFQPLLGNGDAPLPATLH